MRKNVSQNVGYTHTFKIKHKCFHDPVYTAPAVTFKKSEFVLYYQSFYSPTDAQLNCLKNNFKIYIKIDIKRAPTCFVVGAVLMSILM
jgi:hypothetical protein